MRTDAPEKLTRLALAGMAGWALALLPGAGAAQHQHGDASGAADGGWRMPPMESPMAMVPGLAGTTPTPDPFLPGLGLDPMTLPEATFRRIERLGDGDTLRLSARLVRRRLAGRTVVMYGFNGQYPGPLIRVDEGAEIVVDFTNEIDLPTAVHWHGVRVENRFDGVPGVTQEAVPPGSRFEYRVRFPDAGIYWYHPHHREDVQQDMGLYGNMLVDAPEPDYWAPVNAEEVVTLDDVLLDDGGIFPFGEDRATHVLMGRFGNHFLVNGDEAWSTEVRRGDVVRFYLTNVANTRTFNVSFGDLRAKLVGADIGKFERESWVGSVPMAPAQRYVVEVRFDEPGVVPVLNRVRAIDHFRGEYYARTDTLGTVRVVDAPTEDDHGATHAALRDNADVAAEFAPYREHFDRPVDHRLDLTVRVGELPQAMVQLMALDTAYFPPVEWDDTMPMMNYVTSSHEVEWVLREGGTGRENMDIAWRMRVGDVRKIRVFNDPDSFHPMHHPIHIHGQRFLVLSRDGIPNDNLVWKDTALVPVGSTVDLLLEASNPGRWMLHCHIAEHLEAGMKMVFEVEGEGAALAPSPWGGHAH